MSIPIRVDTFADITAICINRAKIAGEVNEEDKNFIQAAINETYINICSERPWTWRKFDRSFPFYMMVTDGTVNVTNGSRIVTFSTVPISNQILFRTLQIMDSSNTDMYRIIGFNATLGEAYLDSVYVGPTNATATFNLYQYEFPLPPDCDTVNQVYIDGSLQDSGQLEEMNVLEFNRYLSKIPMTSGFPRFYTRDGDIYANANLPVLDEMVLDYDFLAGEDLEKVPRLRIMPISPDIDRIIHLNYTIQVQPMILDDDKPIMPVDDRWVLIHGALYEWWKTQGNMSIADREMRDFTKKLTAMRDEYHKTDTAPKAITDGRRYRRYHAVNRREDMFLQARANEYNT